VKRIGKRNLYLWFPLCIDKMIWGCHSDPTMYFTGCMDVTQLAARVLLRLGYGPRIMQGKALSKEGRPVGHVWIEIPEVGLRVETNPSQILGMPRIWVWVTDQEENADLYDPEGENPELLERVTPEGERFFGSLVNKVLACIRKKVS